MWPAQRLGLQVLPPGSESPGSPAAPCLHNGVQKPWGDNLEEEKQGCQSGSRGSEVQDTPSELSTHRLAKRRVLSGHSHHHGNVSPSESAKAADKPPTRVWDPFRHCLTLDPVPVATQVNAVSPQNPKTQQHLLRLGPRARSCDLEAPFFPSSAHWGRAARLTLKAR